MSSSRAANVILSVSEGSAARQQQRPYINLRCKETKNLEITSIRLDKLHYSAHNSTKPCTKGENGAYQRILFLAGISESVRYVKS